MGRLTHRKENGEAAVWLYADPEKPAEVCREQLRKEKAVLEKLAYYEDLEEAGRLLELPEGLDIEKVVEFIRARLCPHCVGLKDCPECSFEYSPCDKCWEATLRGVE